MNSKHKARRRLTSQNLPNVKISLLLQAEPTQMQRPSPPTSRPRPQSFNYDRPSTPHQNAIASNHPSIPLHMKTRSNKVQST